jgi:hypothetical protein
MLGRVTAMAAALALLAACGSVQSAGRNAREGASAPPVATQAPAQTPPPAQAAPPVAAPEVSVAPPAPQPQQQQRPSGGDIVVPGQVERQVEAPDGDPRSAGERMADIRAWDRCVMQVQGQGAGDPLRPQLESPEEVCRDELGMANRTALPASRR